MSISAISAKIDHDEYIGKLSKDLGLEIGQIEKFNTKLAVIQQIYDFVENCSTNKLFK